MMTSCAPVLAFSRPGIGPAGRAADEPGEDDGEHDERPGPARAIEKPTTAATHRADGDLALGADVEQSRPEPRATDRPAKISGVVTTSISESGRNAARISSTLPEPIAEAIFVGLPTAPGNSAR